MNPVTKDKIISFNIIAQSISKEIISAMLIDGYNEKETNVSSRCWICKEEIEHWQRLPGLNQGQDESMPWKNYTTQVEIDHVTSEQHQYQKTLTNLCGT